MRHLDYMLKYLPKQLFVALLIYLVILLIFPYRKSQIYCHL